MSERIIPIVRQFDMAFAHIARAATTTPAEIARLLNKAKRNGCGR